MKIFLIILFLYVLVSLLELRPLPREALSNSGANQSAVYPLDKWNINKKNNLIIEQ